jgi:hypothetical protein
MYQAHSHRPPEFTQEETPPPAELALAVALVVFPVLFLLIPLLVSL